MSRKGNYLTILEQTNIIYKFIYNEHFPFENSLKISFQLELIILKIVREKDNMRRNTIKVSDS